MRAIDIRYNRDIIGEKASPTLKRRIRINCLTERTEIEALLSVNGHPNQTNPNFKSNGSRGCINNCSECWRQEI